MPTPRSSNPDPDDLAPGRVLAGRFRIEKLLGRGGMGEVLLAQDTLLHRRVALKHLRTDRAHGADLRSAILKEARRASEVANHRIATIHDVVDLGDDVLIVMEYVEGETLRKRLAKPLPLELFWDLSGQCLEALGAAHAKGVIHRDIKPENLMVTHAGEVKVLDFGIARRRDSASGAAAPDSTTTTIERFRGPAGTPLYMAPEAHYGGRIDERTDIFSLGAVFYEMLTARHPFTGDDSEHVLDRIMHSEPTSVSELNPAVTPALASVITKMLARDPALRFASCEDVARALAGARAGMGEPNTGQRREAQTDATTATVRRPRTPPRLARAAALVLAAAAIAIAAPFAWRAATAPRLPKSRNLALLLPATPGATADFSAFALGSLELLAARLQRHQDEPGFQMASLQESADEKLGRVEDARKLLGANLALVPTFVQTDAGLRARLELREPVHGQLVATRLVDVPLAEPVRFADSLYHAALAMLGLPPRRSAAGTDLGVRGAGTLRFLAQGIGRMRAAETPEVLQRALDDLETACRTEPDAAMPRAWLAVAQLKRYRQSQDSSWLARAVATAREGVSLGEGRSETHRVLAEVLSYRGRPQESLGEYQRACALDTTDDDAWYRQARTWQHLGDPAHERSVYLAAIARRPDAWRPRWWLAGWDYRQGQVDAAKRDYSEMIRRAPDFSKGYASLGGLLVLEGEYRRAIDTLRIAVGLRPSAAAYGNLGTACFNSGRLSEAVDAYNQAFQFGEVDYTMWLNLGDAYYWLRDRPDQARDAYIQGVRVGRELLRARAQKGSSIDPMTLANMATVFPKIGQPDSARVCLAQALAADSSNAIVEYCAALTHWELGDRPRALGWLERAVAGGYPTAWLRDSPVHREWRAEPRFRDLLAAATTVSTSHPSPGGGSR